MNYKINKGQYFYGYLRGAWRIYKASEDTEDIRYSGSGSVAYNERSYSNREDARKRVYELNGWSR